MGLDDNFIKFDLVEHMLSHKVGKIVELNRFYGWCIVEYADGARKVRKEYNINDKQQSIRRLTKEEVADFRLKQEKLGITNDWGE